jgi:hypothetical protein
MKRSLLLLALGACALSEPESWFVPAMEPFDPGSRGFERSRPVLLVADCQLHNLLSLPVADRDLSSESLAETSIRPPQLDLFAPDVLRWILANEKEPYDVILHLGDAMDFACADEFESFVRVMGSAGKPWLMAPGNHDCFYFGSYDPVNPKIWDDACDGAGGKVTKDRFIRLYVAALLQQSDPGMAGLAESLGLQAERGAPLAKLAERIPDDHEYRRTVGASGFLVAIAWHIDREHPWRSYVLQCADLRGDGAGRLPLYAFLIDSCQYWLRPVLVPNAWTSVPVAWNCGYNGQMLGDQLRRLRTWFEVSNAPGVLAGVVLMCHHPFGSMENKTRASLRWLWSETPNCVGIVTAHTHKGFFTQHRLPGGRQGLELNLGSTTDWPMEWRTFSIHWRQAGEFYLRSLRRTLSHLLTNKEGWFLTGWEVPEGSPDDYRRYKTGQPDFFSLAGFALAHHLKPPIFGPPNPGVGDSAVETERIIKDSLLATHARLVREFPTDARTAAPWPPGCASDVEVLARIQATATGADIPPRNRLLAELAKFEGERHTVDAAGKSTDDMRVRYKISQAVWASRYETTKGRVLRSEDELIRIVPR